MGGAFCLAPEWTLALGPRLEDDIGGDRWAQTDWLLVLFLVFLREIRSFTPDVCSWVGFEYEIGVEIVYCWVSIEAWGLWSEQVHAQFFHEEQHSVFPRTLNIGILASLPSVFFFAGVAPLLRFPTSIPTAANRKRGVECCFISETSKGRSIRSEEGE